MVIDSVFITAILLAGIRMAVPIAYVALGEVMAERSGVLNIGVEGQMLLGAFMSLMVMSATNSFALAIIAAGLGGSLGALIIGYMCITRLNDQTVVGIVFNIFMLGLTSFLFRALYGLTMVPPVVPLLKRIQIPLLSRIPIIGEVLFNQNVMVYLLIILAFVFWYLLFKTKIGLQLRATGENPSAAQAAGVNVFAMRYGTLLLGGFMAGVGGAFLTLGILGRFVENVTAGRGFIGLAVNIFSRWNPLIVLFGGLFFGIAYALQLRLQTLGVNIPYQFLIMLPYLLTLLSLITVGRGVRAPGAIGQNYKKE